MDGSLIKIARNYETRELTNILFTFHTKYKLTVRYCANSSDYAKSNEAATRDATNFQESAKNYSKNFLEFLSNGIRKTKSTFASRYILIFTIPAFQSAVKS